MFPVKWSFNLKMGSDSQVKDHCSTVSLPVDPESKLYPILHFTVWNTGQMWGNSLLVICSSVVISHFNHFLTNVIH